MSETGVTNVRGTKESHKSALMDKVSMKKLLSSSASEANLVGARRIVSK